jgi:hypothetical protein
MAKLVKIKDIHLYVGFTESSADCYEALKLLREFGIKFNFLNFGDQDQHHEANFKALGTWSFGLNSQSKQFNDYPILVWDEFYDDWSTCRCAAHGLSEIKESNVIKFPNL